MVRGLTAEGLPPGKALELLVAALHRLLDGDHFDVQHDVTLTTARGTSSQIDVLLTPKSSIAGPTLISCKDKNKPVSISHAREWATIVQQRGAALGVIVSRRGFTRETMALAGDQERRLQLWLLAELRETDFEGYIQKIHAEMRLRIPFVPEGSLKLDVSRVIPAPAPQLFSFTFSALHRDTWFLRDEADNIVGNIWDDFVRASTRPGLSDGETLTLNYAEPRFIVLEQVRMLVRSVSWELRYQTLISEMHFDALKHFRYQYTNVLTGETRLIPSSIGPVLKPSAESATGSERKGGAG
jgi:hypothetical protein